MYRSASSGNLHQISAANMSKVWELSNRVSKLESEVIKKEKFAHKSHNQNVSFSWPQPVRRLFVLREHG